MTPPAPSTAIIRRHAARGALAAPVMLADSPHEDSHSEVDSVDTSRRATFRLMKFPEPKRRTHWRERPNSKDREWIRLWANLHTVHELAPHGVTGLALIVDKMIVRLENGGDG